MVTLHAMLASHPIQKKPYNTIKFARFDGNGVALYRVGKDPREIGAGLALKGAFEKWGWTLLPLQGVDASTAAVA